MPPCLSISIRSADPTMVIATYASDIEKVIREVKEELGPAPGNSLCEAIRRGNKDVVRKSST